ncbi:hypothetical protein IPA_07405 [Ignicoccus pacificus DSM 13166]|uniref:Uncharacterized protein n=1 Tax=Ignicoccus pacificus DSM 13166 TaxID=940294 RepID=A0A977KCT6_9CREN|nr:hypothetical protein IPA_07405 [Ignicoccus pacificus DSM 13166]
MLPHSNLLKRVLATIADSMVDFFTEGSPKIRGVALRAYLLLPLFYVFTMIRDYIVLGDLSRWLTNLGVVLVVFIGILLLGPPFSALIKRNGEYRSLEHTLVTFIKEMLLKTPRVNVWFEYSWMMTIIALLTYFSLAIVPSLVYPTSTMHIALTSWNAPLTKKIPYLILEFGICAPIMFTYWSALLVPLVYIALTGMVYAEELKRTTSSLTSTYLARINKLIYALRSFDEYVMKRICAFLRRMFMFILLYSISTIAISYVISIQFKRIPLLLPGYVTQMIFIIALWIEAYYNMALMLSEVYNELHRNFSVLPLRALKNPFMAPEELKSYLKARVSSPLLLCFRKSLREEKR